MHKFLIIHLIKEDLTSNLADYEFRQEMIKSVKDKLTQTNLDDFVERLYDDCRS